jgi:hypothetical protein
MFVIISLLLLDSLFSLGGPIFKQISIVVLLKGAAKQTSTKNIKRNI